MNELNEILAKFATSGWDLISLPAKEWLNGNKNKVNLINAVKEADLVCGSCGCEFDPLYKRALYLLNTL